MYRVEHSTTHLGPYRLYHRDDLRTQELCHAHSASPYHPTMHQDFYDYVDGDDYVKLHKYSFGFVSIKDLNRWFNNFQEILAKKGYVIKIYRVKYENVVYGRSGRQIMFKRPLFPVGILKLNNNHARVY